MKKISRLISVLLAMMIVLNSIHLSLYAGEISDSAVNEATDISEETDAGEQDEDIDSGNIDVETESIEEDESSEHDMNSAVGDTEAETDLSDLPENNKVEESENADAENGLPDQHSDSSNIEETKDYDQIKKAAEGADNSGSDGAGNSHMSANDETLNGTEAYRITVEGVHGQFETYDNEKLQFVCVDSIVVDVPAGNALGNYLSQPDSTDREYYFEGWSLENNGDLIDDIYEFIPDSDMTVYAVWGKYKKIQFDANGGVFPESASNNTNELRTVYTSYTSGESAAPYYIPYYEGGSKWIRGWSYQRDGDIVISQTEDTGFSEIGEVHLQDGDTLYAVWEDTVTVTLDANGGYYYRWDDETNEDVRITTIEQKGARGGEFSLSVPNNDNNLDWIGWSTDKNGESIIDSYIFDEDTTLYAVWGEPFTITFDLNGGHCGKSVYDDMLSDYQDNAAVVNRIVSHMGSIDISKEQFDPVSPEEGKSFVGWSLEKNGSIVETEGNDFYPTESCTLYAVWEEVYTIVFDANGGSFDCVDEETGELVARETTSVEVPVGNTLSDYTDFQASPPDSAHYFRGWSREKNGDLIEYMYEVVPESDMTLYALWGKYKEVRFDANGGVFPEYCSDNTNDDRTIFTKKCYEGVDLPYYIPFYEDGSKWIAGWSFERDGEIIISQHEVGSYSCPSELSLEDGDILYAIWKNKVTVTLDSNGGYYYAWDEEADEYVRKTSIEIVGPQGVYLDLTTPDNDNESQHFCGWSVDKNGNSLYQVPTFDENTTLYAVWREPYTITFDLNGGYCANRVYDYSLMDFKDHATIFTINVDYGDYIDISKDRFDPKTQEEGHVFLGWSLEKNGDIIEEEYQNYYPGKSCTLYAVWGEGYTVTLDGNGGRFLITSEEGEWVYTDTFSVEVPRGDTLYSQPVSYPDHSDPDYYFIGWSREKNGDPLEDYYSFVPDTDTTLYAVWGKYKEVLFDANGGIFPEYCSESTNDDRTIYRERIGDSISVPGNIPHYEDGSKVIVGWSFERDGQIVIDQYKDYVYSCPDDLVLEDGDILYAVWEDAITVTLDANGGYFKKWDNEKDEYEHFTTIQVKCPKNHSYETEQPLNDDPELMFVGWNVDKNEDYGVSYYWNGFSRDTTIYAIWKKSATVTFDLDGGFCGETVYDNVLDEDLEHATVVHNKVEPGNSVDLEGAESDFRPSIENEGKVFAGWSLSRNGKILNDSVGFEPEEDCTLYAVWKDAYTVTFDLNGGHFSQRVFDDYQHEGIDEAAIVHKKVEQGGSVDTHYYYYDPVYEDASKFFYGWSLTRNGNPIETDYDFYTPSESCTLYALWEDNYNIVFDANGGEFEGVFDDLLGEDVSNVDRVTWIIDSPGDYRYFEIPHPRYVHHSDDNLLLLGWSLTKNGDVVAGAYDSYYQPEGSCTLYAKWGSCRVTLDTMGGYIPEDYNEDWDGDWLPDNALRSQYTRTEGGMTIDTIPDEFIYLPEPDYPDDDMVFGGWSLEKNGDPVPLGWSMYYYVTEACTLYARWIPCYTVTFDAGEGYFQSEEGADPTKTTSIKVAKNRGLNYSYISDPSIDKEGKELTGWSLTPGGTVVESADLDWDYKPSGDCTLYAVWSDICTITYDANGGSFRIHGDTYIDSYHHVGDKRIYLPEDVLSPPDSSLIFAGWSSDKTGSYVFRNDLSGSEYAEFIGDGLTGDITLYAIWKEPDCTITLDTNGGFFDDSFFSEQREIHTFKGRETELDVYGLEHPEGKVLAGFSLSKDSDVIVSTHDTDNPDSLSSTYFYTPTGNCTLYAAWVDPCTVTLDANGGFFEGDKYSYEYDQGYEYTKYRKHIVLMSAVNRAFDTNKLGVDLYNNDLNKTFAGWSFSKDGEVEVEIDASFIPAGDCTLYAVWKNENEETVPVTKITLTPDKLTLEKGSTGEIKAAVEPENATNPAVVWSSSNTKVATVDENGKVTAIAKGSAVITAKAADESGVKSTCAVTVRETPTFSDVSSNYAFVNEIKWAAENGIVSGYDDGTFKPQDFCKRKQVVAFLWRLKGTPAPASLAARFKDVNTKTNFYKAIYWASENNIVLGFGDGTFRPDETCTRGQVVAFLWRLAGRPAPKSNNSKFSDVTKSNSFYKAILWASENGIVKGYSDGTFKPDNNCTRAQIVTFIYRYNNLK